MELQKATAFGPNPFGFFDNHLATGEAGFAAKRPWWSFAIHDDFRTERHGKPPYLRIGQIAPYVGIVGAADGSVCRSISGKSSWAAM